MAEEQVGRKIEKPFALTFREAILVKLDGGQLRLRFRRDGTPRHSGKLLEDLPVRHLSRCWTVQVNNLGSLTIP